MANNTLQNKAYDYLYKSIITQKLPSGSPIVEQQISDLLGISRTPVREALKMLMAEGLVRYYPSRGMFVSEISIQDIEEVFDIREALEEMALRHAFKAIPEQEIKRVRDVTNSLVGNYSLEDFFAADRSLHNLIFYYSGNRRIGQMVESLNSQVEKVRRISVTPQRIPESLEEHKGIIEAIVAQDQKKAVTMLKRHIRNVKKCCIKVCRQTPPQDGSFNVTL
ncbi:MAG: GntR family transcriptional regulator [Peptococcaceae bacterium]